MSIVNYNYASNAAANVINRNESLMDKTMARISSGSKVGAGHADSWHLRLCIPTCRSRERNPGLR